MLKETLMKVSYFSTSGNEAAVEDEFLASAALTLKTVIFCRSEYISVENLIVIERGIAAKDGRISIKGACLGEDMVLNSYTFRDLDPAIALTFVVQVSCLEKSALEALIVDYPLASERIRHATFKLAFRRAVIQVAKVVAKNRAVGVNLSILEGFSKLRKNKESAMRNISRNMEPTSRLLANNIVDLADRTEAIAKEGTKSRRGLAKAFDKRLEELQGRLDSEVSTLDAKLDAIMEALRVTPSATTAVPAVRVQSESHTALCDSTTATQGEAARATAQTQGEGSGWLMSLMGGSAAPAPPPPPVTNSNTKEVVAASSSNVLWA
jgi:hypothetical protein